MKAIIEHRGAKYYCGLTGGSEELILTTCAICGEGMYISKYIIDSDGQKIVRQRIPRAHNGACSQALKGR